MSLFGKVLALLNLFGAGALVYFAIADYNRRTAWSQGALRHELALYGLPVNNKEVNKQYKPRAGQPDAPMIAERFADVGGRPVSTQEEEVRNLKGEIDDALNKAAGEEKDKTRALERQTFALAKVLLPLAHTTAERNQVQAALYYFANNQSADALKQRHQAAIDLAFAKVSPSLQKVQPLPTVEQAYQFALRTLGEEPNRAFSILIARQLPSTRDEAAKVKIAPLYEKAVEQQYNDLKASYEANFAVALGQAAPEGAGSAPPQDLQKAAIARLLFAMALYRTREALAGQERPAEDEALLKGLVPGTVGYEAKLPETTTFDRFLRRTVIVTGPRALTDAVMHRTAALRAMTADVQSLREVERAQFVSDHASVVRQLRVLANVLAAEETRLRDLQGLERSQDTITKSQANAVSSRQSELSDSIKRTKAVYEELKQKSGELLKNRQAIQQTIRDTREGEEHIRELESLARKLDSEKK